MPCTSSDELKLPKTVMIVTMHPLKYFIQGLHQAICHLFEKQKLNSKYKLIQFCYLRLYLSIETVLCCLLRATNDKDAKMG